MSAVGDDLAAAQARIAELEAATAALEQQQRVQAALYRIAETANAARDLQDFYASIHEIVSGLTYGENFYIALYDREREMVSFPYFVDSVDKETPDPDLWEPFGSGRASGLTAFVLRTGLPQHVPDDRFQRLVAEGEVEEVGAGGRGLARGPDPIRRRNARRPGRADVEPGQVYTDEDVRVLTFVGQHVGSALSSARASAGGAPARRRARDRERGGPGPGATARLSSRSWRRLAAGRRRRWARTGCRSRCSIRRSGRPGSCTGCPGACASTTSRGSSSTTCSRRGS